jgi:leucyl-tRNA---protein transferase
MHLDETKHMNRWQWYATASYPCSYLPDRTARSQVVVLQRGQSESAYNALAAQGFRRSGAFVYRPLCEGCTACQPVRLRVADFRPTRSQRRAAALMRSWQVECLPLKLYTDHLDLYQRYQASRHAETIDAVPEIATTDIPAQTSASQAASQNAYTQFLLRSSVNSNLIAFRDASGALQAVSVVDWLADGLSAVYSFFEPEAKGSLGTACVMWMAAQAAQLGLAYVYLGYWIDDSPKMAYKSNFQPLDIRRNNEWHDFK